MVGAFFNYLGHNVMGNWNAGTWNVLPAVLTTWSNLLATKGNKSEYALYKEQAKNYIDTARENADLIKSKGEIALRNLVYKDKLERGRDVATLGAAGGNLSGTNLDVLVQKEKVRKMDEQTLKANYSSQAMLEIVNGYRQAGNTYGTLAAKATADKWATWASILKGVETYVGLSVRDAKIAKADAEKSKRVQQSYDVELQGWKDYFYGTPTSMMLNSNTSKSYDAYSVAKAIDDFVYDKPSNTSLYGELDTTPNSSATSLFDISLY